jgi:hypothetical protein
VDNGKGVEIDAAFVQVRWKKRTTGGLDPRGGLAFCLSLPHGRRRYGEAGAGLGAGELNQPAGGELLRQRLI